MRQHVLIVEDDEAIAAGLALNLTIEGYLPSQVQDGGAALEKIRAESPALVVLDISLPVKNGLEVLRELRAEGNRTPVVVLSARQDEFDKVAALRLGADDYVTKPFALAELLARIAAVLRRTHQPAIAVPAADANGPNQFGDVVVDLETRIVTRAGQPLPLTHLEFELLVHFCATQPRFFPANVCWGRFGKPARARCAPWTISSNSYGQSSNLDPESPRYLVTVRGSGYRFDF